MVFATAASKKGVIERLDQGHLYPLGERRDKHVTGGARTSALLKSYSDSLYAGYSEPLLGLRPGLQPVLYMGAPVHVQCASDAQGLK